MSDPTNFCLRHPGRSLAAECIKFGPRFCAECFTDPATRAEAVCSSPDVHCQSRPSCLVWSWSREERKQQREG